MQRTTTGRRAAAIRTREPRHTQAGAGLPFPLSSLPRLDRPVYYSAGSGRGPAAPPAGFEGSPMNAPLIATTDAPHPDRRAIRAATLHTSERRPRSAARGLTVLALVLATALAAASPAAAAGFRFVTDNDFLADNGDDLYSFGVGFELHRGRYTLTLKENGFTDRAAGVRFDETFLTVGRSLPLPRGWDGWGELGAVHVGNGLLGETFQNDFHELIQADTVRLDYVEDGQVLPVASFAATRLSPLGPRFAAGPYVEASAAPGLKSHVLAAAQASWDVHPDVTLSALVGARHSEAELAALEPRMGGTAAQAELTLVWRQRVALSWSYNASGTRQEHLAIGWRVGADRGFARALTR